MIIEETKSPVDFEPGHKELVGRGLIAGALPLKFAYAGSSAAKHDKLSKTQSYKSVTGAAEHVGKVLREAGVEDLTRIAEIGPGNGKSSVALVTELNAAGNRVNGFLGLDFSEELLRTATVSFAADLPGVSFSSKQWDMETGPTDAIRDWRGAGKVPVMLLGNTIGNLDEPVTAIGNILDSIDDDLIVLSATLRRPGPREAERMIAPYENEVFYAAALEPLIAFGIQRSSLDFTLSYQQDGRHEVIGTATLSEGVTVLDTELPPGHRIRCFRSQRYASGEVEELIRRAGGVPGASVPDGSGEHLVVTATKG